MITVQELPRTQSNQVPSEHRFQLRDGAELFYRAWLPNKPTTKSLLLFHRGHEHSGRWEETVAELGSDDIAVFAWDQRGHGRSAGERGTAPDIATVIRDADEWVRHLIDTHGIKLRDTIVLAHSLGAVVATAWVHDYAPPIRGMILATPAFRVKLYVPFAVPLLRLKEKIFGAGFVKSYVKASMLTHDRAEAEKYDADPLIFRQIAVNMLLDLHDTAGRLLQDAGAMTVPLLVLAAESDWVVKESPQRQFVERVSSKHKQFVALPGFSHAVFHEKDRHVVVDHVRGFIEQRFAEPPETPSLLHADQSGYTHDEYVRLCKPGGWHFALMRWMMRGLAWLSSGIAIGQKHGYDSGAMLDYVYENQARGFTPIGRLIDRIYLDAPGWRSIRVRRQLLVTALKSRIETVHGTGQPVKLLDIAAGPGRYVLETIHELQSIPISAVLSDYKQENLDVAAKLCDRLALSNVTFKLGDAFDHAAIASIKPRPNIAIVSGLYELFPDNERVLKSLRGLAAATEAGGFLVYTNQPWHPQLEFIARTLTNREGQPWIMRRRTQAEMDQLVSAAGFAKISQETDPCGLFTVSVARRTDA